MDCYRSGCLGSKGVVKTVVRSVVVRLHLAESAIYHRSSILPVASLKEQATSQASELHYTGQNYLRLTARISKYAQRTRSPKRQLKVTDDEGRTFQSSTKSFKWQGNDEHVKQPTWYSLVPCPSILPLLSNLILDSNTMHTN
jgi:hypothetical protein